MMASVACRRPKKSGNGERGQALLELVPVATLLLLLTFGVIECSYAIWQVEVLTALTREGSNLASRDTPLPTAATYVLNDGSVLNSANGGNMEVIVTAVQNLGGTYKVTAQSSTGTLAANSRIGIGTGATATLPTTPTTIPLNGSVYVTEVFSSYAAITPLGAFVNVTMPSVLYDVAYF